jgi:hypothetical protein
MIDLYLRFDTQQDALAALRLLGITRIIEPQDEADEPVEHISQGSHQYALWEVGEIPGIDGYHINIRIVDPNFDISSLEPYRVYPKNPVCIWA